MTRFLLAIVAVAYIGSLAYAQEKNTHSLVIEANQAFSDSDYAAALETYKAAELILPASPELAYNQGAALYMLGDYVRARDAFSRALLTREVGLEAKAKFNLGNTASASALKKMSDPPAAIDLLKSAISHYRDAIELDPEDIDARANIEYAQELIKDLLDRLKQQQEKRRKQQDDQQEQQGEGQDEQQGGQQAGLDEVGDEQQPEEWRQQPGGPMKSEEVEQLLQAVRDKERQRQGELARRQRLQRTPVAKDW